MKKVIVGACVIVIAAAINAYASPPAVDTYIQAIASLAGPTAKIPTAPKGYGAVRDEQTGDFYVLVPKEYCGTNPASTVIPLGQTRYGSQIVGYCQEF